ncbi:MAG: hypothetical protein GY812_13230 [Actinomycetia bacterium]|nr:hypothetical protein [Actinomycetes bacterium]
MADRRNTWPAKSARKRRAMRRSKKVCDQVDAFTEARKALGRACAAAAGTDLQGGSAT